jgi:hypothetical protein
MLARISTTFLYVLIALTAFVAASESKARPGVVSLASHRCHCVDLNNAMLRSLKLVIRRRLAHSEGALGNTRTL